MPKRTKKRKDIKSTPPVGASLKFPGGERCGLTAVALSVSSDKKAPGIVREILQNSLDAAKDAGRECAKVVFSLEKIEKASIPGINDYQNAINKVAEYNQELGWPDQSKNIVDSFKASLKKDKLPVLFVSDNGIGLNKKHMSAILSDGINVKDKKGSSGSKGNGHFTTFNLSNLRYLLYGGVSEADGMLASGHAILSSHQGKKDICGKNGYYVKSLNRDINNPFSFPTGSTIPSIIMDKLKDIKSTEDSGALLGILDFNYFGVSENNMQEVRDLVLVSAARNFFASVKTGELVVIFKSEKGEERINADNLESIINDRSPKIGKTRNFPSHEKANKFYRLFVDGQKGINDAHIVSIKTTAGNFDVIYRQSKVVNTSIALCRNGMWITDDIPSIKPSNFTDQVPFEALILCNETETSTMVRNAEGNLHNNLDVGMVIDESKRRKLRNCLQDITKELAQLIKTQDNNAIEFIEIAGIGMVPDDPGPGPGPPGPVDPIIPPPPPPNPDPDPDPPDPDPNPPGPDPDPPSPPRPNPPKGKMLPVRCIATRQGAGRMKIRVVPLDDSADVELRLVRNGGGDFSCDDPTRDNKRIILKRVICGSNECKISHKSNEYVRIGKAVKGEEKSIDVEFDAEKIKGDYKVDCKFIRRRASND